MFLINEFIDTSEFQDCDCTKKLSGTSKLIDYYNNQLELN